MTLKSKYRTPSKACQDALFWDALFENIVSGVFFSFLQGKAKCEALWCTWMLKSQEIHM